MFHKFVKSVLKVFYKCVISHYKCLISVYKCIISML